jgi:inner membrane protein
MQSTGAMRRLLGRQQGAPVPSIYSHAVAGLALGACFYQPEVPRRIWMLGAACAVLPDLDVLGLPLGVPAASMLGHRGLSHSLFFAAALAGVIVAVGFRHGVPGLSARRLWCYLALATASHGLLDGLTDGGMGVAYFAPFWSQRYFLPWQPIHVSPLGLTQFATERGFVVFPGELVWVWLPSALLGWFAFAWQRWRTSRPAVA